MTRPEAELLIRNAVAAMSADQPELFELDVSERAICHQLAVYLAREVSPGLHVDVEYNRDRKMPKRLNLPRRNATDEDIQAVTVFPDVVVHVRDSPRNEIVLEIKKPGESIQYDQLKLQAFRDQLGYRHCAHLILGRTHDGNFVEDLIWI
jgi:hypothetical protein